MRPMPTSTDGPCAVRSWPTWLSARERHGTCTLCSWPKYVRNVPNPLSLRSCDGLVDSADPDCAARK